MDTKITLKNDASIETKGLLSENNSPLFNNNGDMKCNEIIEAPIFTASSTSYGPSECLDYSNRTTSVGWSDSEISEPKNAFWNPGNIICLKIKCSNGDYYFSYNKVVDRNNLQPLHIYNIQKNDKQFVAIGRDGTIYCNFISEGI